MKKNPILLLSKDESYLLTDTEKDFNVKSGLIKAKDLKNKKFGDKIKTHLGKEFYIVRPNILDVLNKKVKRSAQVILPKDVGLILAYTGIRPDSKVVDIGTGSGFLAIFIANFVSRGEVITYEKNKEFFKIAKENIKMSGLKNIKIKLKDASKGIDEKNVDLITIDIQNPEKLVKKAYKSLKIGGYLVIYSPTIDELIKSIKALKKFSFSDMKIVENIVREWQAEKTIRPKTTGLMHTGFLIFARKI
jgi:tRNA (adenine57-N1/adenine58-N1)-methyltransferase